MFDSNGASIAPTELVERTAGDRESAGVAVYGKVPLSELPAGTVIEIENPCPHGLPAESCFDDQCFDWWPEWSPPDDPDGTAEATREDLPGARQALACEAAASAPDLMSRAGLLEVCEAAELQIRWAQAVRMRMLAEFHARHPADTGDRSRLVGDLPTQRWVPDEVGLTLDISRFEAIGQIALADRFTTVLPDTLALLETGQICWRRAEYLAQATRILPDDKARQVEALVLPKAPDSTPRQMQDRTRRAIAKVDPDGEYRRHTERNTERRVAPRSLEDGMASLWCYGSAEQIEPTWNMIDRLARSLGPEDPRTLPQRRFDLTMQILQGKITVTDPADVDESVAGLLAAAWSAIIKEADSEAPPARANDDAETADPSAASDAGPSDTDCGLAGHADAARTEEAVGTTVPTTADSDTATETAEVDGRTRSDPIHPQPPASPRPPDDQPLDEPAAPIGHVTAQSRTAPHVPPDVLADALAHTLAQRPDLHATVRKPLVQVVVGLDTLLGSNRPAELVGHGPIDADTARTLAADAVIQRLISDPVTGTLLEHGRKTYTPPAALADHVRSRDQICRGPRCTRRVRDLDHHIPYGAGHEGETDDRNLNGYCLHCHLLKDVPGWNVVPGDDGTITWISPCGRRTVTEPFDYRDFTDDLPDWDGNPPAQVPTDSGNTVPTIDVPDDDPPPF